MIETIFELVFTILVAMGFGWWAKSFYDECAGTKSWQERMREMEAERERERAERFERERAERERAERFIERARANYERKLAERERAA